MRSFALVQPPLVFSIDSHSALLHFQLYIPRYLSQANTNGCAHRQQSIVCIDSAIAYVSHTVPFKP
jgi:hypothetical protein